MPTTPRKTLLGALIAIAILVVLPGIAGASQPKNYWLVSSTGQVFAYGKAKAHGSEAHKRYAGRITGIKGTANGGGYWIVTTKKLYGFGDTNRYKYRAGGLKKYTGKLHPKGLRGKIVGYAVATIPAPKKKTGGSGTKTTTTTTTTTPPPTVDCSAVTIQTSSLSSPTATDPYRQTLTAAGVSGGTWSWTLKSGTLPSGLTLSSAGVISGTPAADTAGTQTSFTVQATNSRCPNNPATRGFTLSVAVPPMNITTQSLNGGTYGDAYSQTMSATGGQPGDYDWSATGLPSDLSMSPTGVLSGTPTTYGTYNIEITVSDPTGATPAVSTYLTLAIVLPPLQITSPSALSDGQATVAYSSVTFTATGGTAMEFPPQDRAAMYDWSATGLPAGLSLSTSGALSGTPTQSGSYSPQITVTDAGGGVPSLTQTFTLNIALAPLAFTTTTLTAIEGQSYSGQIVAQGGQAPYSIALVSGSPPDGLQLNDGTITGTPTAPPGSYTFTIGLTDDQNDPPIQETFNMEIAPSQASPDLTVSNSMSNTIWAGYVEQSSTAFTSSSGTFTVPAVNSSPQKDVITWVGIDGYGKTDLIQAGITSLAASNGTRSYEAWWDTVPSPIQGQFDAAAGDAVNVNIWQITTGQWEITLNDTTSGQGFATTVSYTGSGNTTAEWIVETPSGSPATGYASTSSFSNLQASQSGSGMLDLSTTGATPGALTSSGFSISDYN